MVLSVCTALFYNMVTLPSRLFLILLTRALTSVKDKVYPKKGYEGPERE